MIGNVSIVHKSFPCLCFYSWLVSIGDVIIKVSSPKYLGYRAVKDTEPRKYLHTGRREKPNNKLLDCVIK